MTAMRNLTLLLVLALGLCSQALAANGAPARSGQPDESSQTGPPGGSSVAGPSGPSGASGVTGARVVSSGEAGKASSSGVTGSPGVRFGLEIVPDGPAKGAPVVLQVVLSRPNDGDDAPAARWFVPARVGLPAQCFWEFAYDWEVEPGDWTMSISHGGQEIARAVFTVSRPAATAPATVPVPDQGKTQKANGTRQGKAEGKSAQEAQSQEARRPEPGRSEPGQKPQGTAEADHQDAAKPQKPQADAGKSPPPAPAPGQTGQDPAGGKPPREQARAKRIVGGAPSRTVYALMAGAYSTEAKALWMASFDAGRGVSACVRRESLKGRVVWQVVAGWRDSREAALRLKDELAPKLGDILVRAVSAAELEKGLSCK